MILSDNLSNYLANEAKPPFSMTQIIQGCWHCPFTQLCRYVIYLMSWWHDELSPCCFCLTMWQPDKSYFFKYQWSMSFISMTLTKICNLMFNWSRYFLINLFKHLNNNKPIHNDHVDESTWGIKINTVKIVYILSWVISLLFIIIITITTSTATFRCDVCFMSVPLVPFHRCLFKVQFCKGMFNL